MKKKLDCLKLVNFIEKSKDFDKRILSCRKILLAYSGGQDSTVLLTVFYILSRKWQFTIGVVYCNHRWTNSNLGSVAVFEILQNLSLPFYFVDPKKTIQPEKIARDWRYSAFKTIYLNHGYDLILTGHTLSDCAETLILNLCRGSGLRGVCSLKKFQSFKWDHFNHKFKLQNFAFDEKKYLNFKSHTNGDWKFNKRSEKVSFGQFLFKCYESSRTTTLSKSSRTMSNLEFFDSSNFPIKNFSSNIEILKVKNFNQKVTTESKVLSQVTYFDPVTYSLGRKKFTLSNNTAFDTYFVSNLFKLTHLKYISGFVLISTFQNFHYHLDQNSKVSLISWIHYGIQLQAQKKIFKIPQHPFNGLLKRKLKIKSNQKYYYLAKRPFNKKPFAKIFFYSLNYSKLIPGNLNDQIWPEPKQYSKVLVSNFYIYRPLIPIKRETISIFVSQLNLSIIYDQSNDNLNITRNFIRHIVLPLLKKINPQVEQNLYKFSMIASFYLNANSVSIPTKTIEIFKA